MRCDDPGRLITDGDRRFQSLSGFLMRCDKVYANDSVDEAIGFNPYRVF